MGIVYEAFDRKVGERVALKLHKRHDARNLLRFKNEFRAIQCIDHPNLVRLLDLVAEDGNWFYTMELIDGVDFMCWVRGTESRDATRLRHALGQLSEALGALHAEGKVHRDVKPNNVLIRADGQLTLLDFGLITGMEADDASSEAHAIGTAGYMAPEQAAGFQVGPPADWYSVGVMLYEALTGRPPFSGRALQILLDKQQRSPTCPSEIRDGVPADLERLCMALLAFDPATRPELPCILEAVGTRPTRPPSDPGTGRSQFAPFVGRTHELALLNECGERALSGPVTAVVRGESGVGKTELVSRFVDGLDDGRSAVVVLRGRCYERESVPFKALDGVVDSLSRFLSRLHLAEAAAMLPRRAGLLPRLFPVLQRVEAIARAPIEDVDGLEVHERRRRMFEAFRNLLHRVAERARLVIAIDDMQWADHDSEVLLSEITREPDPPPLLLVATARPTRAPLHLATDVEISLGPLGASDARDLAARLLERLGSVGVPEQIAAESRGHPLFVHELVRYASEADAPAQQLRLHDALVTRAERLPEYPRELLRVLSVAGTPIPPEAARLAARQDVTHFQRARATLCAASLARASTENDDRIEPYHDCVRAAISERLDPDTRHDLHERLALALKQTGTAASDPEIMVPHLCAIEDLRGAAAFASQAAERASDALAFDQAARFYRLALRLGSYDADQRRALNLALAKALTSSGMGLDAARAFDEAAQGAEPATALECRRQSAEQLLICGHIEAGMSAMHELLTSVGVSLPRTPRQALVSILWSRFKLRLRRLRWKKRHRREIAESELVRLEVFRTAANGLALVDTIRGADFQVRGLLLALRLGDPVYVGYALGLEAGFRALQGSHRSARRLRDMAVRIAEEHSSPYLDAFLETIQGITDYFAGSFEQATERLDHARDSFRAIPGSLWEINSTRVFGLYARRFLGDYRRMENDYRAYLRDAELRGDRYLASSVRRLCGSLWLVFDQPEKVEDELARAEWVPSDRGFHVQHFHELIARGEQALYTGRGEHALASLADDYERLRRSLLTRAQSIRTQAQYLWGRLALSSRDKHAARCAARLARRLERETAPYPKVWAAILAAGAASRRADHAGARTALSRAAERADACSMRVYAAAARMRLGELAGDADGDRLIASAAAELTACGVVDPAAMARTLVPLWRAG